MSSVYDRDTFSMRYLATSITEISKVVPMLYVDPGDPRCRITSKASTTSDTYRKFRVTLPSPWIQLKNHNIHCFINNISCSLYFVICASDTTTLKDYLLTHLLTVCECWCLNVLIPSLSTKTGNESNVDLLKLSILCFKKGGHLKHVG